MLKKNIPIKRLHGAEYEYNRENVENHEKRFRENREHQSRIIGDHSRAPLVTPDTPRSILD